MEIHRRSGVEEDVSLFSSALAVDADVTSSENGYNTVSFSKNANNKDFRIVNMSLKFLILLLIFAISARTASAASKDESVVQKLFNFISSKFLATPKSTQIYYDKLTRRFYLGDNEHDEVRSRNRKSISRSSKETSFFDSILDFFTGGFFSDFIPPTDRKPPKKKLNPIKQPDKDEDFPDIVGNLLDGLDYLFGSPFRSEDVNEDQSSEELTSSTSTSPSSPWFNWFRSEEITSSADSEEIEPFSTTEVHQQFKVTTDKSKIEHKTVKTSSKPTSKVNLKITSAKKDSTVMTTTMTPTTEKLVVKTTSKPKTTTESPTTTVNKKPSSQNDEITTTTPKSVKISSRRPNNVFKHTVLKTDKDCNSGKKPSLISQMFDSTNTLEQTTEKISETSTKAPEGWFSYLSSLDVDDDDDDENDINTIESPLDWLSNFFNTESSTKVTASIPNIELTSTVAPLAESNWFDSFLTIEEDDATYLPNKTDSPKKGKRKTYHGFQLLRMYPNSISKMKDLKNFQQETQGSGLMWWSIPALNRSSDLLVPRDLLADVKDHLTSEGIQYKVMIWDLQKAIAYENPRLSKRQRLELESIRGHPLTWRRYHRYADILRYMEYLSLKYPEMVELLPLGRSSEGMPLVVVKVVHPQNKTDNGTKKKWKLKSKMKPAIWIDGGIHAREWISPAVATWILHNLIEGEHGNGGEKDMLRMADWYIMPVVNPDGYEYTHTKDRLWRKTRSVYYNSNAYFNGWFPWNWGNTECMGVDLNRNWDFYWGKKGSSDDPCSDYYAGPFPFSEPETKSISDFLMENKDQMKVYLSLHSYAQMWMMPSTHSREPFVDNAEVLEMGKLAINALSEMSGTKYEIGTLSDYLQPITGTAHDWAKSRAGIKYSYSVKMRDSHGPHGFLLPGSQITPTAKETWEAIKAIADNI